MAKAWQGHVTTCVHQRVAPLAQLLGADWVITVPADLEKAENRCYDLFRDTFFDLCIITSEDYSCLSESFCQQISKKTVKTGCEQRLSSDKYGFFRRFLWHKWTSVWPSVHQKLNISPLDHFRVNFRVDSFHVVFEFSRAFFSKWFGAYPTTKSKQTS